MGIFSRLRAALPGRKPIKRTPSKIQVPPRYLGSAKGSSIANSLTNTTNLDRAIYARGAADINASIANLVRVSPDLSNAVATKISTAISKTYTVVAYDEVGRVDEEATITVQSLCQRWDCSSPDNSRFSRSTDFRSLSSSMLLNSFRYGSMLCELVLGPGRLPQYPNSVDTSSIKWADNTIDSYPVFSGKEKDVPLNFPTIFYSSTQQDSSTPYAESPLQTALQPALWDAELNDHLRRAAHRNLLQRLVVSIDSEKWLESLPPEVRFDEEKLREAQVSAVAAIEEQLKGLSPEDSLVVFSTLDVKMSSDANRSEDRTIQVLNDLISGQLSSGSKILPSVIGRGESSGSASTEAMLFLKAAGYAQLELDTLYSRMLTLAVRLLGHDASVKFRYSDVNLRPEIELESFKMIKQSRLYRDLSLGLRSDIEVSIELTGTVPPKGYVPLSGTRFDVSGSLETSGNNYSNTSAAETGQTDSTQSTKESQADEKGVPGKNSGR